MSGDPYRTDVWWDAWRGIVFTNAKVLRVVSRDLETGQGISLVFLDVLSRLNDEPDHRLRMQELQDRLLFTYSGLTRLVDRISTVSCAGSPCRTIAEGCSWCSPRLALRPTNGP